LFAKNFAATVEKNSGGRIKPEIYPASQLGAIPRQIEGTQFGAIQCAILPPEFFVGVDQRFEVLATPGLVDSVEHAHLTNLMASSGSSVPTTYKMALSSPPLDKRGVTLIMRPFSIVAVCRLRDQMLPLRATIDATSVLT
jgi:hypothetical protein